MINAVVIYTFSVKDWHVVGGETGFGLDAHKKWGASSGGDAFAWEMLGFETQRECTFLKHPRLFTTNL